MGVLSRRRGSGNGSTTRSSSGLKAGPPEGNFVPTDWLRNFSRREMARREDLLSFPPKIDLPFIPSKSQPSSKYLDIFTPQNFEEYVGQDEAKETALIMINAAKIESRPLPNILIDGEYGLGKTTLAKIIVITYDGKFHMVDATTAAKDVPTSGTIIIDEIHRLPSEVCDQLNVHLDTGRLHIVGSSTDMGQLPPAFRSRFRQIHLHAYTVNELREILTKIVERKGVIASPVLLSDIAKRSRFNARLAIMNLMFVFDVMAIRNERELTKTTLADAFKKLGLDTNGFIPRDYQYMNALPKDKAVGIQYIAAVIGVDSKTIEEEIEPYLMRRGLIDRTPRGRVKVYDIGDLKST